MKKGEEDDNAIATTAASSLLALVNGLDYKSNKFNQLDEMQNHMSNLITAQNEKTTGKKTTNKTPTKTKQILMKVLLAHQNTKKRPHKKAKRNEHLTRQAAIVIAIRYTKTS